MPPVDISLQEHWKQIGDIFAIWGGPPPVPPRPSYLDAQAHWPQEGDYRSQDYLFVRYNNHKTTFCVCDGVGKSFMGELAAQYLGTGLTNRLWLPDIDTTRGEQVEQQVRSYLAETQAQGDYLIQQVDVAKLGNPIEVRVQKQRREEYGSHTVFTCGRIDFNPYLSNTGHVFLAWMGNIRIRVRRGRIWENITLNTLDDNHRWTTKGGMKGELSTWVGRVENTDRIVIYTDGLEGLDAMWSETAWFSHDQALWKIVNNFDNPIHDDYTLLDISLRPTTKMKLPELSSKTDSGHSRAITLIRIMSVVTLIVFMVLIYSLRFDFQAKLMALLFAVANVVFVVWIWSQGYR